MRFFLILRCVEVIVYSNPGMCIQETQRDLGLSTAETIYRANEATLRRAITPTYARQVLTQQHGIPSELLNYVDDNSCIRYVAMSIAMIVPGRKTRVVASFDLINDDNNQNLNNRLPPPAQQHPQQHRRPFDVVVLLNLFFE